jgi:RNA polymerase-binding transcription factor DksA
MRGASSDDDEHDPEGPTLSSEWSRLEGLLTAARHRAGEADAALTRIRDGGYGICTACARPIARGRLEARPLAELCIDCASAAGR